LLFIAAVGGFLLNLTPCVLPLIPIKIMGLAKAAGNRKRSFSLGLAMSLGVVAFWVMLAIAMSTIVGFKTTHRLFQYPAFTLTVGVIICVMAVGMSSLFTVRLPSWIYAANPSQDSLTGSFLFGILTAVLSTPCTAPFMGAAAAWSVTQSPFITMSTFGAIGMGMALPYFVLSTFPSLLSRVPRTGPGSELVKQIMSLLMLAAGAYFLGTGLAGTLAEPPDPPSQTYWWLVAFFIAIAGLWLLWRTFRIASGRRTQVTLVVLGLTLIATGFVVGIRFTKSSPIHWIYFTPERFAAAHKSAKVIVLEFTAAWCLNCHGLEQGVLHNSNVVALMNSGNVIPIKVDLTGNNSAGSRKLRESGRSSIPYLVIYSPDGNEVFASDAYTVKQILEGIQSALR
jgi:thiol:disulfide interchange protein DsbD